MWSLHLFCRAVHRQICVSRVLICQAAAAAFHHDLTRPQFYSPPSSNISTSCKANRDMDEVIFYAKGLKQTRSRKSQREPSVFSADSAKRRVVSNKEEDPPSMNHLNTRGVTLPLEPLGSDGWSKLNENSRFPMNYDQVMTQMVKMGTDIKIVKSFLSFLAEKDGDISYRVLVMYLTLCTYQNHLAELCDLYDIMKMKFQSFDTGASSLFIRGLGQTDRWRESLGVLERMRKLGPGSVSARNYADCVKVAIKHQESALAWRLYDEMLQNNLVLPEDAMQSLFEASQDLQDDDYRKRLISFLRNFREVQIYPGEALMKSIKSWFESIPNETWRGTLTRVSHSGHCRACKQALESIHLTPEEYSILKKEVIDSIIKMENVFRKTTPQELQEFLQFMNSHAPYDIVVDGLNVAHYDNTPYCSQALMNVVCALAAKKKRILVLGRKHMLLHSRKWQKSDIEKIKRHADCFFLDNISLDDPFLIYACMHSGNHCYFLTKDLLRDHKACLPDPETQRLFFKWQRGHQLAIISPSSGNIMLQLTQNYDTILQNTDTSYHIPYVREGVARASYEVPLTWLCLKKEQ